MTFIFTSHQVRTCGDHFIICLSWNVFMDGTSGLFFLRMGFNVVQNHFLKFCLIIIVYSFSHLPLSWFQSFSVFYPNPNPNPLHFFSGIFLLFHTFFISFFASLVLSFVPSVLVSFCQYKPPCSLAPMPPIFCPTPMSPTMCPCTTLFFFVFLASFSQYLPSVHFWIYTVCSSNQRSTGRKTAHSTRLKFRTS